MTTKAHSVIVSSARLSAQETGTGPAVVLIHAGVTDQRAWRRTVDGLGDRYRVITYDRRGFGATSYDPEPYSALDDLLAVLDFLGIESAAVAGCSNGGQIAMQAAINAAHRVSALILIDSAPADAPPTSPWPAELNELFASIDAAETAGNLPEANRLEAQLWLDGPLQPADRVNDSARALFFEMNAIALAAPSAGDDVADPPHWEQLGMLRVPTLVVAGAHDVPQLVELSTLTAAKIADARLVLMPQSAHLPMLDDPEAFTASLGAFLDAVHQPATEPDTVTEAAAFLSARGYDDEFELRPNGLAVRGATDVQPLETAIVDYQFRFEGPSDPADEAIVLGIRCPQWTGKGVVISAFGSGADPEEAAILRALARPQLSHP